MSALFTLLIAVEVQAQKPILVPLIDIFEQVADESDGERSKYIYLMQRCSGLQLAMSSLIEDSSPDLSKKYIQLSSKFAIEAATARINLARERGIVDPDVERMAAEARSIITSLYQDYMNWANENYRLQGAYFESDPLFKQEIEICGALSGN
jgi:dGTP triphosphohydrolase